MRLIPRKMYLTRGLGVHKEKLTSFEMALREAGIAQFNLVRVSSIFPPHCQIVTREEGLQLLQPGEIVFSVLAETLDAYEPIPDAALDAAYAAIDMDLLSEELAALAFDSASAGELVAIEILDASRRVSEATRVDLRLIKP